MVRTPRPAEERRAARWIARAGAILAIAGAISLALPTIATIAADPPTRSPVASRAEPEVRLDKPSRPVRIRVPYAGIDLPIVTSERKVPGNVGAYPLCDVAQYWTKYAMPGAPGTAWIYAHAQPGMFLPLFTISEATNGKGLLGKIVEVQLRDGRLLRYRITQVKERAYNRKIAGRQRPSQHRLILQTSTGPPGTVPKLQVAARLIGATVTDEPRPDPQPRACWQPKPKPTPRNRNKVTPESTEVIEAGESIDATTLVLGSAAVLLGATVVAVYLIRREP